MKLVVLTNLHLIGLKSTSYIFDLDGIKLSFSFFFAICFGKLIKNRCEDLALFVVKKVAQKAANLALRYTLSCETQSLLWSVESQFDRLCVNGACLQTASKDTIPYSMQKVADLELLSL